MLSRCIQLNLKSLPNSEIVDQLGLILKDETIKYEEKALRLLANAAKGSMRDGLSLLDQAIAYGEDFVGEDFVRSMLGLVHPDLLVGLLKSLVDDDGPKLFSLIEEVDSFSPDYASLLAELVEFLHRVAVYQAVPHRWKHLTQKRYKCFQKRCTPNNCSCSIRLVLLDKTIFRWRPTQE